MISNRVKDGYIVVVNDTPFQLKVLCSILAKAGYRVDGFESAEAALEGMRPDATPDLVITDLHMPGIDGWRFCRLIRSGQYEHLNDVPILLNSATFAGEDILAISKAAGADAFIETPYRSKELLVFVEQMLAGDRPIQRIPLLLCDPDPEFSRELAEMLDGQGYDVALAHDAAGARKLFKARMFASAVIDSALPGSDEMELLVEFKSHYPGCAILFTSDGKEVAFAANAIKQGASAFIQKPFSADYLVELIQKANRERNLLAVEELLEKRSRKLFEEEERHRAIMEAANEGFCVLVDGRIQYANPAFERMAGSSADELLGKDVFGFVKDDDRRRLTDFYRRYMAGADEFGFQRFVMVNKNRRERVVELSASRITFDLQSAVLCVLRDVTEVKRLENELDLQRRRYAEILSYMQIGVMLIHRGRQLSWSNDFARNEAGNQSPMEFFCLDEFYPEAGAKSSCPVALAFATGEIHVREFKNPRNGKWYFLTAYPILGEDGRVVDVLETIIDTTERKKMEHKLRLSEQRFRLAAENSSDLLFDYESETQRLQWFGDIQSALQLQTQPESLEDFLALIHPGDLQRLLESMDEVGAGLDHWSGDYRLLTGRGDVRYWHGAATAVFNDDGKLNRVIGSIQDITSRRRREQILSMQRDLSVALTQARSLQDTLDTCLSFAIQASGMDGGGVYLFEEDGRLELKNHAGLTPEFLVDKFEYSADSQEALFVKGGESFVGTLAELQGPLPENDLAEGIRALGIIPIRYMGKSLGCFNVTSFKHDWISDHAKAVLDIIAGQVAYAITRDQAVQSVRIQERNLSTLFDSIDDFLVVSDAAGKIFHVNATLCAMLGYAEGDLVGRQVSDLYAEAVRADVAKQSQEVLSGSRDFLVIPLLCRDGGEIPAEVHLSRGIWNSQPAIFGMMRNISERLQMEQELRHSESQFREIFSQSPIGIEVFDVNGNLIKINDACLEMFGVASANDLVDFNLFEEPNLDEQYRKTLQQGMAPGNSIRYETEFDFERGREFRLHRTQRRGVAYLYVQVTALGILGEEKPTGYLVQIQDVTSHRRANDALRESEERYATIVTMAPEAIVTSDLDGIITFANEQSCLLFQAKQVEAFIGKSIFDFVNEDDAARVIRNQQLTIEGNDPGADEYGVIGLNGRKLDVEVHAEVLRNADHSPSGWLLMLRDITEQKRMQTALRASETRFKRLIQNLNDILMVMDARGNTTYVSDSIEDITGFSPEEFIGHYGIDFVHPDDVDRVMPIFNDLLNYSEQTRSSEYRHKTKSGGWVYVEAIGTNWLHDPSVAGIVLSVRDITERREAEKELRFSEDRLRRAEFVARIGNWTFDFNTNLVFASDGARDIYGLGNEELTINMAQSIPLAEERSRMDQAMKDLVAGEKPYDIEFRIRRLNDGQIRVIHSLAEYSPQRNIVFGVIEDITERKQAEDLREQLEQQLLQAMKMEAIGRLAGGVAHDFNNLLTGITGNVSIAQIEYQDDPDLAETLDEINQAAVRAAGLTRQLLAFSRKQILEPRPLDLNDLIEHLVKMVIRLIGEDIKLGFKPQLDLPPVMADHGQIEQVIINLCVNARDAMPDGGSLAIETKAVTLDAEYCESHRNVTPGSYVRMSVRDNGIGMDEETRGHIFEPFFTTKPQNQGTGLGLATIYGIIKQHNGNVDVESEPGKGTVFHIYLPCSDVEVKHASVEGGISHLPHGRETILLVEDEAVVRSVGSKILNRLGYRVLEASCATDAYELFDDEADIDLLVTDIIMPGENGHELAKVLCARRPKLKVLFTSGYTEDVIAHHGVLNEGLFFIGKPFTPVALAHKIRDVLDTPDSSSP